jgi:putative ABC transport system permease protein
MRAHVDLYTDELVARGRPPEEARREARLAFGNPRVKLEELAQMNRLPMFDTVVRDLRYAVRVLRRTPAFTATSVITLALVIGACTAVFSLADAILLRPLPYPEPDRLAMVETVVRSDKGQSNQDSQDGATWEAIRDNASAVDAAVTAGGFGNSVNLVVGNAAALVSQARVGAGYFHVLGELPLLGREFTPDEDRPGGPAVAVLSYGLWQRVLNGDPAVLGKTIRLKGEAYQVVGIMPERFKNPGDAVDVWTPVRPSRNGEGSGTNYGVYARVKDGHTWQEANAELEAIGRQHFEIPEGQQDHLEAWLTLVPMQEAMVAEVREPIQMLAGAVGMVLLIACVNLAVLLIARAGSRTREIATRMALGSGRGAVVRQLMVESLVLGLVGGAVGLLFGYLGLAALKALGGDTFREWTRVSLDGRMLAATVGLSLLTSVIFGLVPALQASRLNVIGALADGGSRSVAGASRHWGRRALIGAEVALGVVLLVVTGLLVRTFVNLSSLDPGFDPAHVMTASVSLQDARYQTAAEVNRLFDASLETLQRAPGVESAAVSLELPYKRLLNNGFKFSDDPPDANWSIANVSYVTPTFFETLRIPVRRGRTFSAGDRAGAPPVTVVNDMFVRIYTKGENPIGRRIVMDSVSYEIVGVVGDVQVHGSGFFLDGMTRGPIATTPLVFIPAAQTSDGFLRVIHTWFAPVWSVRTDPSVNGGRLLQQAINQADPLLPVFAIRDMSEVQSMATAEQRLLMTLVGVLAVAALLLSAVGIHGLIAHSVAERTREFGIRMALGATALETVRSVAASGLALSTVGAAVGIGLAWVAVRLVASFLWGVDEHDPLTFIAVAAFLVVVAGIASLIPALRILRLDPAQTLRQ